MTALDIPEDVRGKDEFHHIDMGFLNRRLCIGALSPTARRFFYHHQRPGEDHMTVLTNDHLLVTALLDSCEEINTPTLLEALSLAKPIQMFRSTERLAPCPEIRRALRVCHAVELDLEFEKPVFIEYHTSHVVSQTGKMILEQGAPMDRVNSIVGLLHETQDSFKIEPLVIGQPWFEHPRNGDDGMTLMCFGRDFGEVLPEDIDQFSRMTEVDVKSAEEWMNIMKMLPEERVKEAIAHLLSEPTKKDWGGERDDHFSASIMVHGRRRNAAFLLKGPSPFREMTLDMCGRRADQIHRVVDSDADVSVIQHSHLIGSVVRRTLRNLTVYPGGSRRKYCLIDGQATYRILKAYSFL